MSKTSLEELLSKDKRLIYTNVGDSMLPLIKQGRDLLVIEKPSEWDKLPENSKISKLKKYDIALYKRDGGKYYVLHRVLKIRDGDYVICGDNRWHREYGITDRHVLGKLTGIIRNGKEIQLSGLKYRLYLFFWCNLFPFRAFILRVRSFLRRRL
jgi:signal peptidase I